MQRLQQSRLFTRLGTVVVTLVFIAAVAVAFGAVHTLSARAAPTCSVASLKGNYGGNFSGWTSSGPLAMQVQTTFHGDGTGTSHAILMTETSGPISYTSTVTYTVNSDCTGTVTIVRHTGQRVHFHIVLVDNATEVDNLQTDPGFVVTGVLKA